MLLSNVNLFLYFYLLYVSQGESQWMGLTSSLRRSVHRLNDSQLVCTPKFKVFTNRNRAVVFSFFFICCDCSRQTLNGICDLQFLCRPSD